MVWWYGCVVVHWCATRTHILPIIIQTAHRCLRHVTQQAWKELHFAISDMTVLDINVITGFAKRPTPRNNYNIIQHDLNKHFVFLRYIYIRTVLVVLTFKSLFCVETPFFYPSCELRVTWGIEKWITCHKFVPLISCSAHMSIKYRSQKTKHWTTAYFPFKKPNVTK